MKKVKVSSEVIQEGKNIVDGLYDPLKGFLCEKDLLSVLEDMRLSDGSVWSMPIVLDIDENTKINIKEKSEIILTDGQGEIVIEGVSIYEVDKLFFAKKLFSTIDTNHPGVAKVVKMKKYFLGGRIKSFHNLKKPHQLHLTAREAKEIFKKNKWKNIVAFQTRNPPHRSHEYLQKKALSFVDGILISPVMGPKKTGDFFDEYIIGAYHELVNKYYPKEAVVLGTFHTFMRYAGPKEAVFHALVRRNLGCTHMIIGRDHAGVGNYYGTYEAQKIFNNFTDVELGIKILKYENVAFCRSCGKMVEENDCQHKEGDKMYLSGTKLREKIINGDDISEGFMRKEVAAYLKNNKDNLFVK